MDEVFGLFPTPFLRCPRVLSARLVDDLRRHFSGLAREVNKASDRLSHTELLHPADSPLFVETALALEPKIGDMGALLFGQRLGWSIKEMWVNVLESGGLQSMHNHANSFVSGIVYLTQLHDQAQTVFMKSVGATEFVFRNEHADTTATPFNADRWIGPPPSPGDLVLFPSYLLHTVPPNQGDRRITLAFNAIPAKLDAWGYGLKFGA